MITCPHCQTENRPTARFCSACGKPLTLPEGAREPALSGLCDELHREKPEGAPSAETLNIPASGQTADANSRKLEGSPSAENSSSMGDPSIQLNPSAPGEMDADPSALSSKANVSSNDTGASQDAVAPIVAVTQESAQSPSDSSNNDSLTDSADSPNAQSADQPTIKPSDQPTIKPSDQPTTEPSDQPTIEPADQPTTEPSDQPTTEPSDQPTTEPSDQPTIEPTTQPPNHPTLEPLSIGAHLLDRFTVSELMRQDADANVYRARDAWRCPTCDNENEADAVFCSNCGRELTERGTVLLVERAASAFAAPVPSGTFVVDERSYEIQPDAPPAPTAGPTRVQLQYAALSDVGVVRGLAREPNEDSAFALTLSAVHESQPQPTVGLFIVADGIGGSAAGELASKKAIQTLAAKLTETITLPVLQGQMLDDATLREHIRAAVLYANEQVVQLAAAKQNDMGTTVTLALILDDNAYIANAGDSRTYLLRNATLQPITIDHSLVMSLVLNNMLTRDEIYTHPQRNIILRSLGGKTELDVDIFPQEGGALKLQKGDKLLLCSDGLWEMVRDFDIESHLLRETDLQKAAANLVAAANENGGEDNVTLVLVSVG